MTGRSDLGLEDYARLKDVLPQVAHLISRKTIDRRLAEGLVPSAEKGPDGHWIVHLPTLRAWVLGKWPPKGEGIGIARSVPSVTPASIQADSVAARQFERRLAALRDVGEGGGPDGAAMSSAAPPRGVIRHWVRLSLGMWREEHATLQAER